MKRFLIQTLIIIGMCYLSYQLGKSHSKIQIIEKQVEVIKYETKSLQKVYSHPNPDRDFLLKRMRAGQF